MKLKSLKIGEKTHRDLSVFCAKRGYSVGETADFLLRWAMVQSGAKELRKMEAHHGKT